MNTGKIPQMRNHAARLLNSDLISGAGIYLLSRIIAKAIPHKQVWYNRSCLCNPRSISLWGLAGVFYFSN